MLGLAVVAPGLLGGDQAGVQHASTPRERLALDALAQAFMARYAVPGLSVAIGRGGQVHYVKAFGEADAEARETLTPDHRFRIAGISTSITAVAIFTLIEQGRLRLDDPVFGAGAVLGREFPPPYPRYKADVTIEHLLTHTAGGWPTDEPALVYGIPPTQHQALIHWALFNLPLQYPPGTHYEYSSIGYCILGRVIETVTGRSYEDYVRQAVLSRCGVADMQIGFGSAAERLPGEVKYYDQTGDDPYVVNLRAEDSAVGWIATPRDLLRVMMQVDGVRGSPNILRPETVRVMTTGTAANPRYAKGWQVDWSGAWGQTGFMPGMSAIVRRADSGVCWAVCVNTRSGPALDNDLAALMSTMGRLAGAWQV
jgi:CubicO group peptidase (beta-lactamase class C family)